MSVINQLFNVDLSLPFHFKMQCITVPSSDFAVSFWLPTQSATKCIWCLCQSAKYQCHIRMQLELSCGTANVNYQKPVDCIQNYERKRFQRIA